MHSTALPAKPRGLALALSWPRLRFTLLLSLAFGVLLGFTWTNGWLSVLSRTLGLGLIALLAFGLFEQWPSRLPGWLPRWVLQVVSVAIVIPPAMAIIYWLSTPPGEPA